MVKKISVREAKIYLSRMLEQVSTGKLSLPEAKARISRFADHVGNGEDVIITRDGEPVAKLVTLDECN